jgi:transposase, IS30 family
VAIRLSVEDRVEILRLRKAGWTEPRIAREMGRSSGSVHRVLQPPVAMRERIWNPGAARLSLAEREEIRAGIAHGDTFSAIAKALGRAVSTISREVKAGGGRRRYRAVGSHRRAYRAARRPKCTKLDQLPALREVVEAGLLELWSPEEIAQRLRVDFADDPMMRVSHETIYKSLFVQGRGALRSELHKCLRSGRAQRRPAKRIDQRGTIPDKVMISERPAEVADRAVPGNWEGDLIKGKNNRSSVGTLVERSTRYVLLLHLPDGATAEKVNAAMAEAMGRLPDKLARSITWDQGTEMYKHKDFTIATGIPIYFCDPHSPWQRGSNENTNGLLRQFMPKGTDLSVYSRADLDEIERKMNGRPRKTLGWRTPCEKLEELIALTG